MVSRDFNTRRKARDHDPWGPRWAIDYPEAELESRIVATEAGLDSARARQLVRFAQLTRNLKGAGLDEGASTRLLVHAGKLMMSGISPVDACTSAVSQALTDDREMITAVNELCASVF